MRMREGWEPPHPLFKAEFGLEVGHIGMALIGAQSLPNASADLLPDREVFTERSGPDLIERARFIDASGYVNEFWIAYWTAADKFEIVAPRQQIEAMVS